MFYDRGQSTLIHWLPRKEPGGGGVRVRFQRAAETFCGPWVAVSCWGPLGGGLAGLWCSARHMLVFLELVAFSLHALLKDLFWTGLLFLLHRYLHQSGALTVAALQDPAPDPVEGMEEDIADKVGPGPPQVDSRV